MTKIPVLVIAFNRPDLTATLMAALEKYRPTKLYVACDGPRQGFSEDAALVARVRTELLTNSWGAEVQFNFQDTNVGVRKNVVGALDWFFDREKFGVVLEDDCIPTPGFFALAEHFFHHFEPTGGVWGFTGSNTAGVSFNNGSTYGFVSHPLIWGWGTWATRWKQYDRDLSTYVQAKQYAGRWRTPVHRYAFERHLESILKTGRPDTWDYQWTWTVLSRGGIWLVPEPHLVTNLGFRDDATHTKREGAKQPSAELEIEIKPPPRIGLDPKTERRIFRKIHGVRWPLFLNVLRPLAEGLFHVSRSWAKRYLRRVN